MYYKVVKHIENGNQVKLVSTIHHYNYRLSCEYIPGEWVHAKQELLKKGFGLCVFDNFHSAVHFSGKTYRHDVYSLWECEIEPMPENIQCTNFRINTNILCNVEFHNIEFYVDCLETWPFNTVLAKSVKLVSKIEYRNI